MTREISSSSETPRQRRGRSAQARGLRAEALAAQALVAEGWAVLARRCRTEAGEIDLIVERAGLLVFAEVKSRADLASAAYALGPSQRARLLRAAEIWLGANPGHGEAGIRFDLLLVDGMGMLRRVMDAFRDDGGF
jgi:putative endonuclease